MASLGMLAVAALTGCSQIRWETDLDSGLRLAAQQGRRALVQFYSFSSLDCQEMDRQVFSDPKVQDLLRHFVAVRVDTLLHRDLVKQFNVQMTPTFFVIRPDRQITGSQSGKMDAEKLRFFLIKYSYN